MREQPLVAVDIGNSRIKLGLFTSPTEPGKLPQPESTFDVVPGNQSLKTIAEWLGPDRLTHVDWWIGSVQRSVASQLLTWLRERGVESLTLLASVDLPLQVSVPRPDMVGIDRLLGALAANRVRQESRPVIVVDLGTAITVDVVSAEGSFLGGAILPGIGMSARAMHEFTDLLPLLDMAALSDAPPALGTNTVEAMTSGLYWGAIGGVRHLIERLTRQLGTAPQVFLTGGAAAKVANLLADDARYEGHLVLAGIALAAGV
jgi:type III pantothenate kinase